MRSAPEGGIVAMSLTRPAPPKGVHMKKSMLDNEKIKKIIGLVAITLFIASMIWMVN